MGYAAYVLPDGTEAGYGVEAPCDAKGCDTLVWRGVDALCDVSRGDHPVWCGAFAAVVLGSVPLPGAQPAAHAQGEA